ncbi:complement C1q-like protein 2 [Saccostrea echinata]|uniref:complement C1q-like protein 2 n=1 Tax=Saccostrea echinata TaxID=191078 RepID=UPI002A7F3FA7|nr:complement C1q-like protein 2 [Saccostrea echinata]
MEDNQLNISSTLASFDKFTRNVSEEKDDYRTRIIAFTAGFGHYSEQDMTRTDMVFPDVITNVGEGYNPRDGVFTAPINGNYVFYTAVVSWDNGNIATDIVLNGKSQVRTFAESKGIHTKHQQYIYQTGANLVCLSLWSGDRVWVRRHSGSGFIVHPTPMHTFSGFLPHT